MGVRYTRRQNSQNREARRPPEYQGTNWKIDNLGWIGNSVMLAKASAEIHVRIRKEDLLKYTVLDAVQRRLCIFAGKQLPLTRGCRSISRVTGEGGRELRAFVCHAMVWHL
jgi:hypothetical protein